MGGKLHCLWKPCLFHLNILFSFNPALHHIITAVAVSIIQASNYLKSLPSEIGNLTKLQDFYISKWADNDTFLMKAMYILLELLFSLFHPVVTQSSLLLFLVKANNKLTSLPTEIGSLTSLQKLLFGKCIWVDQIDGNQSSIHNAYIATTIGSHLITLRDAFSGSNPLFSLPPEIWNLKRLQLPDLGKCSCQPHF